MSNTPDSAPPATAATTPGGDAATGTNAGTAAADAGSPPAPAPAASADDPFGDLPADQSVFDRGWVDKLRNEGRRYRDDAKAAHEQLSQYDDVFQPYDPADRDVWLDLARQWVVDPAAAASVMQQIAAAVLGEGDEPPAGTPPEQPPAAAPPGGQPGTPGTLTAEQVADMVRQQIAEQDHQRRQEAMVESIYSTMRTAGIEPKSSDGMAVLWIANNTTEGDIDKAIELHKADRQKAIDEYVAGRSGRPLPAPSNGVVANAHTPITNLDEARKAADSYIRQQTEAR